MFKIHVSVNVTWQTISIAMLNGLMSINYLVIGILLLTSNKLEEIKSICVNVFLFEQQHAICQNIFYMSKLSVKRDLYLGRP